MTVTLVSDCSMSSGEGQGEDMEKSFEEEEERLWEHWQKMQDAQLEEEEEQLEYNAADDEYGENWDEELWEEEYELLEEEEAEKKKRKKKEK